MAALSQCRVAGTVSFDQYRDDVYCAVGVRMVTGALVFFALLVAAPSTATAKLPECLSVCETGDCCTPGVLNGCLSTPCGDYVDCVSGAKADFDDCVGRLSNRKECVVTVGGRCTIILNCLRDCQQTRRITQKNCLKLLRKVTTFCTAANCTANLKPRQQRSLARVCQNNCSVRTATPPTSTSTSTTTSTTGQPTSTTGPSTSTTSTSTTTSVPPFNCESPGIDRCMQACLMRIDSLRKDYSGCEDRCEGNACAEVICQETSRNVACLAIKARCSSNGDNIDPEYTRCCTNPDRAVECLEKSEAPCRVLPTTTTSTAISTTTVRTTTSTSTTTR